MLHCITLWELTSPLPCRHFCWKPSCSGLVGYGLAFCWYWEEQLASQPTQPKHLVMHRETLVPSWHYINNFPRKGCAPPEFVGGTWPKTKKFNLVIGTAKNRKGDFPSKLSLKQVVSIYLYKRIYQHHVKMEKQPWHLWIHRIGMCPRLMERSVVMREIQARCQVLGASSSL